jgi:anti-sigma factor RsiW
MSDRVPGEPTCREIVELVTDYVESRMPLEKRTRFEQHLAYCGGCQAYVEQIRQIIRAAGAVREESLDPKAQEELVKLFRDWKGRE